MIAVAVDQASCTSASGSASRNQAEFLSGIDTVCIVFAFPNRNTCAILAGLTSFAVSFYQAEHATAKARCWILRRAIRFGFVGAIAVILARSAHVHAFVVGATKAGFAVEFADAFHTVAGRRTERGRSLAMGV